MDEFLQACGAAGPLLLEVVEEGGSAESVRRVVPRPCAILGRHPEADLVLPHKAVGQRHAYLQVVGGRIACIDLESRTSTRVGGRAEAQAWVEPDDWIEVGPYRIRARIDGDEGRSIASGGEPTAREGVDALGPLSGAYARTHPDAGPARVLKIRDARGDGTDYTLSRVLTLVGGSRLCKIRLREAGTSRFAGALLRTRRGVWVVDLLASDGLRFDGKAIRHRRLEPGEVVQVGPYAVGLAPEFDPTGPPQAPPAALDLSALARLSPPASAIRPTHWAREEGDATEVVLGTALDQMIQMQRQMSEQFQQTMLMMAQLFGSMQKDHMEAVREELSHIRRLTERMETLHQAPATLAAPPPREGPAGGPVPQAAPAQAPDGPETEAEAKASRPDPIAIQVLVGQRLAAYERERQSRWGKVLRLLGGA